jgi:hypothetical protein
MSQTGHDLDSKKLEKTFYHYRGLMIRSLNNDISTPNERYGDTVLAGILTLLMADVSPFYFE